MAHAWQLTDVGVGDVLSDVLHAVGVEGGAPGLLARKSRTGTLIRTIASGSVDWGPSYVWDACTVRSGGGKAVPDRS